MKKLLLLGSFLSIWVSISMVQAASITNISGASDALLLRTLLVDVTVSSSNTANLSNNIFSHALSGGNSISSFGDQSDTTIKTGNISASVTVLQDANHSTSATSLESSDTSNDAIQGVSDGSTATIETNDTVAGSQTFQNTVTSTTTVSATAISGNNTVYSGGKLIGTDIATGAGTSDTLVSNVFNISAYSLTRVIK